jgi:hypothetical protein
VTIKFHDSLARGEDVDLHLNQDAAVRREGKRPMLLDSHQCNVLNNVVSLSDGGAAQRYTRAIKSAACARGDLQVTSVSQSVSAAVSVQ